MSERSCKKCIHGSTIGMPEIAMSRMPCQYMRDKNWEAALAAGIGDLATICKHYEERAEPTALGKAWLAYLTERFGPSTGPETFSTTHGFYRAGWQARGKADKEVIRNSWGCAKSGTIELISKLDGTEAG